MGYLFVALNLSLWALLFLGEKWESKTGRIPPRRKWNKEKPEESFLYLQDWHTGSWGDFIGLSCIAYAFGLSVGRVQEITAYIALALAMLITLSLYHVWKSKGRPDSGFPDGETLSLMGKGHLVYTFLQLFVAGCLFLSLQEISREAVIWLGIGTTVYFLSFVCDLLQGKFSKRAKSLP